MSRNNYCRTLHEAARKVMEMDELPDLRGNGLCYLFSRMGVKTAYPDMGRMGSCVEAYYPERGTWTEARLVMVCLLAETDEEDFSGHP